MRYFRMYRWCKLQGTYPIVVEAENKGDAYNRAYSLPVPPAEDIDWDRRGVEYGEFDGVEEVFPENASS